VSEEERRLAYVALTRARSKLTLLFCTLRRVAVQRRKPAAGAAVNAHGQPLVAHTFTLQRVPPSSYLAPLYDLRRSVRLRVLSDEEREAVASRAAGAADLDSIGGLLGLFVDPGLTHIVG
jgi:ATP-dependent exoDNAse (exonuclease V) beta subunit